jgi:hypothetical protein
MKRLWHEEKQLAHHPAGTSIPPQGHIGAQILNLLLGKVQILGTATSLNIQKFKDLQSGTHSHIQGPSLASPNGLLHHLFQHPHLQKLGTLALQI